MNFFQKFLLNNRPGWRSASIRALFAFMVLSGFQNLHAFSLYLNHVAVVKNSRILLKDISRVEAERYPGRISGHVLFQSQNKPRYIERSELMQMLGNLPEKTENIYGKGVWILPLTEKVGKKELETLLLKEFEKLPGSDEDRKALSLKMDDKTEILCHADCRIDFHLPSDLARLFAGQRVISADITAEQNGKKIILHRQQFTIRVLKNMAVPVALKDLSIGMRLGEGDFSMEMRELDPDESYHATGNLLGRRVVAVVKKGGILNHSSVQYMPTVRRGQSLEVVHQTENLVIKVRSIAARDGEIGESIPVRLLLPSGKKSDIKTVKIVSEQTAVIE